MMTVSKDKVRKSYDTTAKYYDFALKLYALIGIGKAFRKKAVNLLQLKRGDHVVELGCGTGANFPLILEEIGPEGKLTGVDLSPGMLDSVQRRVMRKGWKNVELVQGDIAEFVFPEEVDAVISTGVFGYIEDGDRVIKAAAEAIQGGGRIVIADGKQPERLPLWAFWFIVLVSRPFGVTREYFDKRTWESVERYFVHTHYDETYGGMLFFSSGTADQQLKHPKQAKVTV